MPDSRVLVVGLGNPGSRYERTRHNAGFHALDFFAARQGVSLDQEKMNGRYASTRIAGRPVILLKPQTYMNLSGECVAGFVRYYAIPLSGIIVIHDDLDLLPGRIKMAVSGGAGGHRGIRSLIDLLGSGDFARLKIGIGHPRHREETSAIPVENYVLGRFPVDEWELFQETMLRVESGITLFIEKGAEAARNSINRRPGRTE